MQNLPVYYSNYQTNLVPLSNVEYKPKTQNHYLQPHPFNITNESPYSRVNSFQQINFPKYSYPLATTSSNSREQMENKNTPPSLTQSTFNACQNSVVNNNQLLFQAHPQHSLSSFQNLQQNNSLNYVYLKSQPPQQPYFTSTQNNRNVTGIANVEPNLCSIPLASRSYSQQYNHQAYQTLTAQISYPSTPLSTLSQNNNIGDGNNINVGTANNWVKAPTPDATKSSICPKDSDSLQTNNMSILTDIMAYHHPLIPIIPSASGNTRNMKLRLLKFNTTDKFHNSVNSFKLEKGIIDTANKNANLRTALKVSKWTQEEDELLTHLRQTEKTGWRDISMYFPTRTINACQFRWRRLTKMKENRTKKERQKVSTNKTLGKVHKKRN